MGVSEQNQGAEKFRHDEEEEEGEESDTEEYDSDDTEEDPTFDTVEETRSSFSSLSFKKKYKSPIVMETEEENEDGVPEVVVPELDEEDKRSFEVVRNIIEVGQVEKLKVEQCKVYLRKHGLRLTGNKDTLIKRINEHLGILNGGGERMYPIYSFVCNCKGDACTGDVVMFEQNVYEMFNIASRSASGPPCGTRIVAGRIVKESYGAAKQQHTFTIEVLWSKGEKSLPPLHPLLIKGRNLYRLKTMRQRWEDEGERQKMLSEKHARGSLARSNRETRVQLKETRKMLKDTRTSSMKDQKKTKVAKAPSFHSQSIGSENLRIQPREQNKNLNCKENTSVPSETLHKQPGSFLNVNVPLETIILHHAKNSTCMPSRGSFQSQNHENSKKYIPSNCAFPRMPLTSMNSSTCTQYNNSDPLGPRVGTMSPLRSQQNINSGSWRNPFPWQGFDQSMNSNPLGSFKENECFSRTNGHGNQQSQFCRFYTQGRCYYGDRCKYLHDSRENWDDGQRRYGMERFTYDVHY